MGKPDYRRPARLTPERARELYERIVTRKGTLQEIADEEGVGIDTIKSLSARRTYNDALDTYA
jgi:hypothetical protein